jgi:acrylyl-CoA reductase (NADPH)
MSFQAIVAREDNGRVVAELTSLELDDLPREAVLVEVSHSALNYKDALALCGNRNKIMKTMPFVPGIDLAGTVVESEDPQYAPGDAVVATGWGLGERHWGGFSRFARLKPEWLVRLPSGVDGRFVMALGTAGLTAMLCVEAIEQAGVTPASGEIVVTGASGGVGSIAIMLLNALGYSVVASTGRPEQTKYFESIGAKRVVPRGEFDREARPLEKEQWAAAVDTVGSRTLATVLSQIRYSGMVAACGLAGGFDLPVTVMPFILRNVRLQGIDSVYLPAEHRARIWKRLAKLTPTERVDSIIHETRLSDIPTLAAQMLAGKTRGRSIILLEPTS